MILSRQHRLPGAAFALLAGGAFAAPVHVTVSDADGTPVTSAVAFALPLGTRAAAATPRPAVVDQIDKEFVPFVLPVQAGTAVTFPNRDQIRHHVYSFSAPKPFELKLYHGVPSKPVVFERPGAVALGCNIHDWMVGYVYVVDSPWFAKTQAGGTARLELPPGDYELRVWHPWLQSDLPPRRIKVESAELKSAWRLDLVPPPPRPAQK